MSTFWSRPPLNSSTCPAPSPRCAHACALLEPACIYVYGGWSGQQMMADLHVLHVDSMTWTLPVCVSAEPGSTRNASLVGNNGSAAAQQRPDGTFASNSPVNAAAAQAALANGGVNAPGARAGHTATFVGNQLFIYGGGDGSRYLSDLHVLDTETFTWTDYGQGLGFDDEEDASPSEPAESNSDGSQSDAIASRATFPCARSRHSASLIRGNKFWVFGGGNDDQVFNDVWVLDTVSYRWRQPKLKGGISPPARWGHSACILPGDRIIVFGGHSGSSMLNDVWVLDTVALQWHEIETHPHDPMASFGDARVVEAPGLGNKLGAQVRSTKHITGKVRQLLSQEQKDNEDAAAAAASTDSTTDEVRRKDAVAAPASGERPGDEVRRVGAGTDDGNSDELCPPTVSPTSGVNAVPLIAPTAPPSPSRRSARRFNTQPERPSPRAGHSAVMYGRLMLVFGGGDGTSIMNNTWLLDTETFTWNKPTIGGGAPTARCAHTMVLIPGDIDRSGAAGTDGSVKGLNRSGQQRHVSLSGVQLESLSDLVGSRMMLFGGGNGTRRFKDLYMLDVHAVLEAEEQRRLRRLAKRTSAAAAQAAAATTARAIEKGAPAPSAFPASVEDPSPSARRPVAFAARAVAAAHARYPEGVIEWLRGVEGVRCLADTAGVAAIEKSFAEEAIDFDTLRMLTEEHIKLLGVATMGDRLRIMAARDRLFGNVSGPDSEGMSALGAIASEHLAHSAASAANISTQLRAVLSQQQLLLHAVQLQHSDYSRRERGWESMASTVKDAVSRLSHAAQRLTNAIPQQQQQQHHQPHNMTMAGPPMMPFSPDVLFHAQQLSYAQAAHAQMAAMHGGHSHSAGGHSPGSHSPSPGRSPDRRGRSSLSHSRE